MASDMKFPALVNALGHARHLLRKNCLTFAIIILYRLDCQELFPKKFTETWEIPDPGVPVLHGYADSGGITRLIIFGGAPDSLTAN
jgi:hypothetical protein